MAVRGSTPLQSLDRDNLETIDEMVAERFIVGYLYIDCMNDIYVYMVCIDTHTHTYRIFTYSDLKQIHIHKSNKLKLSYRISVSDPPQTSFGFWEFETSPLGFFFHDEVFQRREEPSAEFRNGGKLNAHRGYPENNKLCINSRGEGGDPTFF